MVKARLNRESRGVYVNGDGGGRLADALRGAGVPLSSVIDLGHATVITLGEGADLGAVQAAIDAWEAGDATP